MALWGGRFNAASDPLFKQFNDSLPVDRRLVHADLEGSRAWARALGRAGVLTHEEVSRLVATLDDIENDVRSDPAPLAESREEDVHSWVESELVRRVGDLGKKLHTGRSRNDQVATDLRLWCREAIGARLSELDALQRALLDLADRETGTVFPGYTHLQRAQPVTLGHWALAYFEMLARDSERLRECRQRMNRCPLGSGALAGTAYDIDRESLARDLGFSSPTANSLDAVSDRDFVFDLIAAAALTGVHLSRLSEDLVVYSSQEFGLVELDESVSSGSSLMPQKKNPDSVELIRGKTGRLLGSLVAITVTLKGLPLAYNKDMQEDKEPLFDCLDTLSISVRIMVRVLATLRVNHAACRAAVEGDGRGGYLNATELADYLVGRGMPFRSAHEHVGTLVRQAMKDGKSLEQLTLDEFRGASALIGPDVYEWLRPASALARRSVAGGTSPARVREAVANARRRLEVNLGKV
ncbi:MAG: argininosuccinate lyase [Phycisphaerae bacterium]|nr:argininosuccinate lyase [Phycisphaerae bacterium]